MDDSFKKAYVEDWVFQITDTSDFNLPYEQDDLIPETPRVPLPVPSSYREAPKPEVSAQEHNEPPLPPLPSRPRCECLELPFSHDDILSGFENLRLPSSDQFTMWGTMTPEEVLAEHVVDIAELRQTSVTPSRELRLQRLMLQESTSSSILSFLCEEGFVFTTGILDLDEAQKMLSRNKLRENGTSSFCRKLLTMLTTQSFMSAFM